MKKKGPLLKHSALFCGKFYRHPIQNINIWKGKKSVILKSGILKRKDSPPIVLKTEEPRFRLLGFLFLLSGGLPELGMRFTTNGN